MSFTNSHTDVVLNDHSRLNSSFVFDFSCSSLNEFGMNSRGAAQCESGQSSMQFVWERLSYSKNRAEKGNVNCQESQFSHSGIFLMWQGEVASQEKSQKGIICQKVHEAEVSCLGSVVCGKRLYKQRLCTALKSGFINQESEMHIFNNSSIVPFIFLCITIAVNGAIK